MAMKRFLFALAFAVIAAPALAQSGPGPNVSDPCMFAMKSSASINLSGPTIASLVAPSGASTIYVCGFKATISPTAFASLSFGYSSTVACTTPTAITGQFGLSSTTPSNSLFIGTGSGDTLFTVPSGNGLCATSTGGLVQGNLSYVQQ